MLSYTIYMLGLIDVALVFFPQIVNLAAKKNALVIDNFIMPTFINNCKILLFRYVLNFVTFQTNTIMFLYQIE